MGQQHSRVIQEFFSTKREYAKKRGVTKLVAPQCVACSTEGKKEFPFSLQKEMRDFASYPCKKTREGTERTLKNWGEIPRKRKKKDNTLLQTCDKIHTFGWVFK